MPTLALDGTLSAESTGFGRARPCRCRDAQVTRRSAYGGGPKKAVSCKGVPSNQPRHAAQISTMPSFFTHVCPRLACFQGSLSCEACNGSCCSPAQSNLRRARPRLSAFLACQLDAATRWAAHAEIWGPTSAVRHHQLLHLVVLSLPSCFSFNIYINI